MNSHSSFVDALSSSSLDAVPLPTQATLTKHPQVPHQTTKRLSGSAAWDKYSANLTQYQLDTLEIAFNTWDEPIFSLSSFEDTLSSSSFLDTVPLEESNSFEDALSSSSSSFLDAVHLEESNSFKDTLSSSSPSLDAVSVEESKELDSELLTDNNSMASEASYDSTISDLDVSGTLFTHGSAGAPPPWPIYNTIGW